MRSLENELLESQGTTYFFLLSRAYAGTDGTSTFESFENDCPTRLGYPWCRDAEGEVGSGVSQSRRVSAHVLPDR